MTMILFSETIDTAIRAALEKMSGFPVGIWTREFMDGYRAWLQGESVDPYYLVLPKNAPRRFTGRIDDVSMRKQLDAIFGAMRVVVESVKNSQMHIDRSLAQMWRQFQWPVDFNDKAYSEVFHFSIKCITEYEKFRFADTIEQEIGIPDDIQEYYDKDERLINVTTSEPLREAFVFHASDLAVIPTYKSDYGLKELFARIFNTGMPNDWKVRIPPSAIIPKTESQIHSVFRRSVSGA